MTTTLDTLAATAGMGWPVIDADTPYRTIRHHGGFVCDGVAEVFSPIGIIPAGRFSPSTNIAHAHMFAERFDEYWINKIGGGTYEVEMNSWAWSHHPDKCIAICVAGLRALGVPEDKIKEALDGKA